MPTAQVNGTHLNYEEAGPLDGPAVVFSHGLLFDHHMFDHQAEQLADRFRVIRYDHRGQGASEKPKAKSISVETLYGDAVALIETLGAAPCHFIGLSMGGFVGLRLAARRPDLLASCTLIATSASAEQNAGRYRTLNLIARWFGVRPVVGKVMPTMFGSTFLDDPARSTERSTWRSHLRSLDRSIYRAVNGVIQRDGVEDELASISVPVLVIVGEEDAALPPEHSVQLRESVPNAGLVRIPRAGHTCTVEAPQAVTEALTDFLGSIGVSSTDAE